MNDFGKQMQQVLGTELRGLSNVNEIQSLIQEMLGIDAEQKSRDLGFRSLKEALDSQILAKYVQFEDYPLYNEDGTSRGTKERVYKARRDEYMENMYREQMVSDHEKRKKDLRKQRIAERERQFGAGQGHAASGHQRTWENSVDRTPTVVRQGEHSQYLPPQGNEIRVNPSPKLLKVDYGCEPNGSLFGDESNTDEDEKEEERQTIDFDADFGIAVGRIGVGAVDTGESRTATQMSGTGNTSSSSNSSMDDANVRQLGVQQQQHILKPHAPIRWEDEKEEEEELAAEQRAVLPRQPQQDLLTSSPTSSKWSIVEPEPVVSTTVNDIKLINFDNDDEPTESKSKSKAKKATSSTGKRAGGRLVRSDSQNTLMDVLSVHKDGTPVFNETKMRAIGHNISEMCKYRCQELNKPMVQCLKVLKVVKQWDPDFCKMKANGTLVDFLKHYCPDLRLHYPPPENAFERFYLEWVGQPK